METIVNFLRDNWQFISSALLALLTILAMIIKKKPFTIRTELQDRDIYEKLISWIKGAESKFGAGHGKDKLQYVLDQFASHEDLKDQMWYWTPFIQDTVELILSTPQMKKKGAKIDGKK